MAFSGAVHEGVVDALAHEHARPSASSPLVMPLAHGHHVGHDAEILGGEAAPRRPKPVMTSSKISRMPCLSQISRSRLR